MVLVTKWEQTWCTESVLHAESSYILHAKDFLLYFTWPLIVTLLRVQKINHAGRKACFTCNNVIPWWIKIGTWQDFTIIHEITRYQNGRFFTNVPIFDSTPSEVTKCNQVKSPKITRNHGKAWLQSAENIITCQVGNSSRQERGLNKFFMGCNSKHW